jgi:glucosamine--fructose-6-phosphate aminotransferase (isomerizing)
MPQDFIPYRTALPQQPEQLAAIAEHVARQLVERPAGFAARRPVFYGIGASHAAAALPVALLRARGVGAHRVEVGELPPGSPALGDVTIAISQGGRSRETVDALSALPAPQRAAVVNMPGTPLTDAASAVVDLGGRQDSKASTVGFTGTLTALAMLTEAWTVDDDTDDDVHHDTADGDHSSPWAQIGEHVAALLADPEMTAAVERIADLVLGARSVDVVGPYASLAAAEEGALLLREVCRIPATGVELRQYLHGSSEMAASDTAHLLLGGDRTLTLAAVLAGAGARVAVLTQVAPADRPPLPPGTIVVQLPRGETGGPEYAACLVAVLETVVFQRVADVVAGRLGLDPDEFVFIGTDTKLEVAPAGEH